MHIRVIEKIVFHMNKTSNWCCRRRSKNFLLKDRKRTWMGIKKGLIMFVNLLPSLLNVLMLVAVVLTLVSQNRIAALLGKESGFGGYLVAAGIGSISLIPVFIAIAWIMDRRLGKTFVMKEGGRVNFHNR